MKRLLPILLLLVAVQGFAQEPRDSAFAEKKDSMAPHVIKRIKKPGKLLDNIIDQLVKDMKQKPQVKNYLVESVNKESGSDSWKVRLILSAEAGIKLEPVKGGKFIYEGPNELTSKDSTQLRLSIDLPFNPILENIDNISWYEDMSESMAFKTMMKKYYNVKVYSITDNSGRGLYRVMFAPKEREIKVDYGTHFSIAVTGTAYFDSNTLHLTRIKGEVSYPKHSGRWGDVHMFKLSFQKITPVPLIKVRRLYQIDYDDTDGTPVVRQIKHTEIHYDKIVSKSTVQEIPE
ncbi:MAG: hypothetical protein IKU02_01805 [Bacteroidaceae bacterium]|nr:hypothetical protein [Bacteroidaceae bacterium]